MRTWDEILQGMDYDAFCTIGARDPVFWIERVFGDECNICPMHREWINEFYMKHNRIVLIAPTGHGKSQIFGIAIPLWLAFFNKNFSILIVSNTESQATGILERLTNYINDNELLNILEPDASDKETWTKKKRLLKNRVKIFCMPYNINLKSYHVNYIFCDEISQYRDHSIFFRYLMTRVTAKHGKLIAATTPVSMSDLSFKLLNNDTFVGKVYMAIKDSSLLEKPEYKSRIYAYIEDGDPIFPQKYSKKDLESIKNTDPFSFEREYMCNVTITENALLSPEVVMDSLDENLEFTIGNTGGTVYIGADFAYGTGKTADYSAFIVVESDGQKYYLRHIEKHRGMAIPTQLQRLVELNNLYKPISIYVDESNIGQTMVQEMRMKTLPVIGCKFDYAKRKSYIINLAKLFEDKKIVIPFKENVEPICRELYEQLTSIIPTKTKGGLDTYEITTAHDDMVMSLALALSGAVVDPPKTSRIFYPV